MNILYIFKRRMRSENVDPLGAKNTHKKIIAESDYLRLFMARFEMCNTGHTPLARLH